jgi:hypothetical protein
MSLRPLAYAKQVSARIASGERVGLLVVSLHCWSSGDWFMHRDDVARVVLPSDLPVERADWSIALARDVVVCGPVPDDFVDTVFEALERSGAASLWLWCDAGFQRVEKHYGAWCGMCAPLPEKKLGAALRAYRRDAILFRSGFYGSRVYLAAREALIDAMPGLRAALAEYEVAR